MPERGIFMDFFNHPPTYERFRQWVFSCRESFSHVTVFPVGKTVQKRTIYGLGIGNLHSANLMCAGWHGQEWLTTMVLMRFAEELFQVLEQNKTLCDRFIWDDLRRTGLILVPMVNPDGIERGLTPMGREQKWQANARGVDLNHNFDANFPACRSLEQQAGILGPGPGKYGGPYPNSEPETRAMVQLCCSFPIRCAWAFHSQGEEIYYEYGTHTPPVSLWMAQLIASVSGYKISAPALSASHGGFKDWFIDKFHRPGFTLEIGKGENPLPISDLEPIYQKLRQAFVCMCIM